MAEVLHGVCSGCQELTWEAVVITWVADDGGQLDNLDICLAGDLVDWWGGYGKEVSRFTRKGAGLKGLIMSSLLKILL